MRRTVIGILVVALLAGGAYAVSTVASKCTMHGGTATQATAASTASGCEAGTTDCGPASDACAPASGKVSGNFDAAMSGVCRFACATKVAFDAKDVVAQPGAVAGKLTQCPVSGVVFAVEDSRPHVRLDDEYVTCCDKCADKLKANPSHYILAAKGQRVTRIQLLSFEGCPNTDRARETLKAAIASAGIRASIEEVDLNSAATPEPLRGWGSPTILVNGRDVGGQEGPSGAACRVYADKAGHLLGFPSAALLRAALGAEPIANR
jgi:hypothetical protein